MIENADSKIAVDFTMYVYEPVSFCHADCVTTAGLARSRTPTASTAGAPSAATEPRAITTSAPRSSVPGLPGRGRHSDGCDAERGLVCGQSPTSVRDPDPRDRRGGGRVPGLPGQDGGHRERRVGCYLRDRRGRPDSCSELEIRLVNPPKNAALMNVSAFEHQTTEGLNEAIFVWPAPSMEARLDDGPKDLSLLTPLTSTPPQPSPRRLHCVEVKIQAAPARTEQVLARFGCHMGLLWSPPIETASLPQRAALLF